MKPNAICHVATSAAVALLLLAAGCASPTYQVRVNSIARGQPATRPAVSYRIRNKNPAVDDQSLRYKEATGHIRTALSAQGLYEAPTSALADMIVELDYAIEPPRVKYNVYHVPVFGRKGTQPSELSEALDASAKELLGYQPESFPVTVREKRLSVCARANQPPTEGRPAEEYWRVDVSIDDRSHDLRGYLPILASAAMDHIGRNTDGETTTVLSSEDEAIQFVKQGM